MHCFASALLLVLQASGCLYANYRWIGYQTILKKGKSLDRWNLTFACLITVLEIIHFVKGIFRIPLYTSSDFSGGYLPAGYSHTSTQIAFTYILSLSSVILAISQAILTKRLILVS